LQSPIAQISPQFQIFAQSDATQLKQFVIVRSALAEKSCRDFFTFFSNYELRFQRVPLFLA
jgi:hypothetical protein